MEDADNIYADLENKLPVEFIFLVGISISNNI